MLELKFTSKFKKDYRRVKRQGKDLRKLKAVLLVLQSGEGLPPKNHDHDLSGSYAGHRECHIDPDWLLIYRVESDALTLTAVRTGSRDDLFGM